MTSNSLEQFTDQEAKRRWLSGEPIGPSLFVQLCRTHGVELKEKEAEAYMHHLQCIQSDGLNTVEMYSRGTSKSMRGLGAAAYALNRALHGIVDPSELKLKVNPVPLMLHGINMRSELPKSRWVELRAELLQERGNCCEACGIAPSNLADVEAHEDWEYSTARRPARASLTGIRLLCPTCHATVHFRLQVALVRAGKLPETHLRDIEDHFCAVNKVGNRMFELHVDDVFENWAMLNKRKRWDVHFGPYQRLCRLKTVTATPRNTAPS
jgi:hypothetical protein